MSKTSQFLALAVSAAVLAIGATSANAYTRSGGGSTSGGKTWSSHGSGSCSGGHCSSS